MLDLATVTHETFEPLVGDEFVLEGSDRRLVLDAVTTHIEQPNARTPFSLEFVGPAEPVLAQQTLALEHPALGKLAVFVVPVGRNERGTRYEAVFS